MHLAVDEAVALGLSCVQVFTKNQQQWAAPPLKTESVALWHARLAAAGWADQRAQDVAQATSGHAPLLRTVSHASYLINLASPDDALWQKSLDLMTEEILRCHRLGIPLLVSHPGSATTSPKSAGIARIIKAYGVLMARTAGSNVVSCLEATVGAGATLGGTFAELAELRAGIAELTGQTARIGFCIDTCHIHAAGYALSSQAAAEAVLAEMHATLDLRHVRCLHLNDSLAPAGSRKDRHAHIGRGTINPEALGTFMRAAGLRGLPAVMETPKGIGADGRAFDLVNAAALRSLAAGRPAEFVVA